MSSSWCLRGWRSKALRAGEAKPPLDAPHRLYAMRFCPFSHRCALVAAAKALPCDVVHIHLGAKPAWHFDSHPSGGVPAYKGPGGERLHDSLVLAEFLDAVSGPPTLLSTEPLRRAQQKLRLDRLAKLHPPMYAWWKDTGSGEKLAAWAEAVGGVERELEGLAAQGFLEGGEPGWVDLMLWPWLERWTMLSAGGEAERKVFEGLPLTKAYARRMGERPEVAAVAQSPATHLQHIHDVFVRDKPNYDLGL